MILVVTGIIRFGLLNIPLEREEGEYTYAVQLILLRIFPYQELYNMMLPGAYGAYTMFLQVFWQTLYGIHIQISRATFGENSFPDWFGTSNQFLFTETFCHWITLFERVV